MPSGDPHHWEAVRFDIMFSIITIGLIVLLYFTYDFWRRVNNVTLAPVNRVVSSVQPPGVTGLKPKEKQQIFKRVLVRKV